MITAEDLGNTTTTDGEANEVEEAEEDGEVWSAYMERVLWVFKGWSGVRMSDCHAMVM